MGLPRLLEPLVTTKMRNKANLESMGVRAAIRHTSAAAGLSENENRHRPAPFLRGPSEVFRIVEINHETLPGIDSCFTVANFPPALTLGAVTAPVGSNTET